MIPFASLCVLLVYPSAVTETAARDLSALGCTFRLPPADAAGTADLKAVEFRFRPPEGETRVTLPRDAFTLSEEERNGQWVLYRLETGDRPFRDAALGYMRAIRALETPEEEKEEPRFPETQDAAMREMLSGANAPENWGEGTDVFLELADPEAWEAYLSLPVKEFFRRLLALRGLENHPLAALTPAGVQAGNPWCPALRPAEDVLRRLADKAASEGLRFTRALAPVAERELDAVLRDLENSADEVTVNDWGTALLLKDRDKTMGALLNRRWKDPRFTPAETAVLRRNDACGEGFRRLVRQAGFTRLEWETCGYEFDLPKMKGTLRLPFYQLNTSSRCPTRAVAEHGDRGKQFPMGPCPAPCLKETLLYPAGSGVICRWNTLFGCDAAALTDAERLKRAAAKGVDRLLVSL